MSNTPSLPVPAGKPPDGRAKQCFVLCPIGDPDSPTRKRSDQVLKYVIAMALEPIGYNVIRADTISQPGTITLQIVEQILQDDLVVADLTDHNPNVFYELAVRHAVDKPVIHMIDRGQGIPFDVAGFRTVRFNHQDLESAHRAVEEIQAQAREIEQGNWGQTPVKLAAIVQKLGAGESEVKLGLAQILQGVSLLHEELRTLKLRFRRPELAGLGLPAPLSWSPFGGPASTLTPSDMILIQDVVRRVVASLAGQAVEGPAIAETPPKEGQPEGQERKE